MEFSGTTAVRSCLPRRGTVDLNAGLVEALGRACKAGDRCTVRARMHHWRDHLRLPCGTALERHEVLRTRPLGFIASLPCNRSCEDCRGGRAKCLHRLMGLGRSGLLNSPTILRLGGRLRVAFAHSVQATTRVLSCISRASSTRRASASMVGAPKNAHIGSDTLKVFLIRLS